MLLIVMAFVGQSFAHGRHQKRAVWAEFELVNRVGLSGPQAGDLLQAYSIKNANHRPAVVALARGGNQPRTRRESKRRTDHGDCSASATFVAIPEHSRGLADLEKEEPAIAG